VAWPIWIPIAAALAVATATSFGNTPGLLFLLAGGVVVGGWLVVVLVEAGRAAWRRAWRRLTSLVAILVCAVPATVVSLQAGDHIHLFLAYPAYAIEIAAAPADAGPIRFRWRSFGLVPSYDRTLIYDPSGELASQVGSARLPSEAGGTFTRTVWHLAGHFYLFEIDFAQ